MTEDNYTLALLLLGALLAGAFYILDKRGKDLRDSIPPSLLPVLTVLLNGALELAKRTPTPSDDELIERVLERITVEFVDDDYDDDDEDTVDAIDGGDHPAQTFLRNTKNPPPDPTLN